MAAASPFAAMSLPPALNAAEIAIGAAPYRANLYAAGAGEPLLLIHSINAAPSAFEVEPIFEAVRADRRVYALELPGFGRAERSAAPYNIAVYVRAISQAIDHIQQETGAAAVDALALSLSCEFLARVAVERPSTIGSLIFVSPTGFQAGSNRRRKPAVTERGLTGAEAVLRVPLWRSSLFSLLAVRPSIRFFLRRTFGSRHVPPALIDYAYRTAHQPNAAFAPWAFLSGKLFGSDIRTIYEAIRQPAWLVHGVRGAFSDFSEAAWIKGRPNWSVTVFDTGAFPHFEETALFATRLAAILEGDGARRATKASNAAHLPGA